MSLKYTCPICGTPLGYKGLCWKCRSEQERRTDFPGHRNKSQRNRKALFQRLGDVEALELTDFRQRDGLIYPLLST